MQNKSCPFGTTFWNSFSIKFEDFFVQRHFLELFVKHRQLRNGTPARAVKCKYRKASVQFGIKERLPPLTKKNWSKKYRSKPWCHLKKSDKMSRYLCSYFFLLPIAALQWNDTGGWLKGKELNYKINYTWSFHDAHLKWMTPKKPVKYQPERNLFPD